MCLEPSLEVGFVDETSNDEYGRVDVSLYVY